jgi:hypothetical protein
MNNNNNFNNQNVSQKSGVYLLDNVTLLFYFHLVFLSDFQQIKCCFGVVFYIDV